DALAIYRWLRQRRAGATELRSPGGRFALAEILQESPPQPPAAEPVPGLPGRLGQGGRPLCPARTTPPTAPPPAPLAPGAPGRLAVAAAGRRRFPIGRVRPARPGGRLDRQPRRGRAEGRSQTRGRGPRPGRSVAAPACGGFAVAAADRPGYGQPGRDFLHAPP